MNISTGISEITVNKLDSNKIYIWPNYSENKVEKIKKIERQNTNPIYFKPSAKEQEQIIEQLKNKENTYSFNGTAIEIGLAIEPGSLFDAIA